MEWRNNFQNHILERGWDYYLDNRVHSYENNSNKITATVSGTENYTVEVYIEGDELVIKSCSCPYAASRIFYKHVAAVMYAYENEDSPDSVAPSVKSILEYVDTAGETVIRNFLKVILLNNPDLRQQFEASLGNPIKTIDMDRFKNRLDQIYYKYVEYNDFIDYHEMEEFHSEISQFMTKTIEKRLIDNKFYKEAFELINIIYLSLVDLPIDDSFDTTIDVALDCSKLWEKILEKADLKFKNEMFKWFMTQLKSGNLDVYTENIEAIIFGYYLN